MSQLDDLRRRIKDLEVEIERLKARRGQSSSDVLRGKPIERPLTCPDCGGELLADNEPGLFYCPSLPCEFRATLRPDGNWQMEFPR